MYIDASAPTRVDLAGGTLDIWPLYLFHDGAQTLNAAISLRARCSIRPLPGGRIVVSSDDTHRRVEVAHWSELKDDHELRLLGRILSYFEATGLELHTESESPVGAGIAGSSAMNVAVCGALAAWTSRSLSPDELMQVAMNVEAQAIQVPTGVQDFRPAVYGGVSAVELRVDGIRRVALPIDASELERRLVLVYTGATRNSGINNWETTKRHIDGDRAVRGSFAKITEIAGEMRRAFEAEDWDAFGALVDEEWRNRKQLAPGVSTPVIESLLEAARRAGARSGKICGAGGGGCLLCVSEPEAVPAVRSALAGAGARVLDFRIESHGLTVEHRVTA